MSCKSAKTVTITIYYTTATVLVQGKRCTIWVREEFNALIDTIRAICALVASHHTQPNLYKEVDEGVCLLPLLSPDNTSMQTTNVGSDDSGVCPPFVDALLAKVVLSLTPSVTGGCPPATPTLAVTTSQSSRPGHATPTQPNGGQQSTSKTTSRRPDLYMASKVVSKKAQAKRSKPTKGSYIIKKQTTNPYSLTKKFNILAAAVRKISNEICALQQQFCTLSTENLCLKPVIKNLKNQSTSPSKSTPDCSYYPQVPTASNPLSPGRPKKVRTKQTQGTFRSPSTLPPLYCQNRSVLGSPPKLRQQHPIHQPRPLSSDQIPSPAATSDLVDSTSRRTAAATTQQRMTQDSRLAATSGHAHSTTHFTSSASGRAPACLRRDERPDRRLGGSFHEAGPGVPWG